MCAFGLYCVFMEARKPVGENAKLEIFKRDLCKRGARLTGGQRICCHIRFEGAVIALGRIDGPATGERVLAQLTTSLHVQLITSDERRGVRRVAVEEDISPIRLDMLAFIDSAVLRLRDGRTYWVGHTYFTGTGDGASPMRSSIGRLKTNLLIKSAMETQKTKFIAITWI